MFGTRLQVRHTPSIAALLLLLVLVLAAGCDTGTTTNSTPISNSNSNNGNVPPAPPAAVSNPAQNFINPTPGQTAKVGTWTFLLTEVNVYPSLPGGPGGADVIAKQAFIVTRLRATNGGTAAAHLAPTDFQLTDSKGHTYAPDAGAQAAFQNSKKGYPGPTQDVPPGRAGDMAIAFDAPSDMSGAKLVVQGQAQFILSP